MSKLRELYLSFSLRENLLVMRAHCPEDRLGHNFELQAHPGTPPYCLHHTRRINTEDKAKVVVPVGILQ